MRGTIAALTAAGWLAGCAPTVSSAGSRVVSLPGAPALELAHRPDGSLGLRAQDVGGEPCPSPALEVDGGRASATMDRDVLVLDAREAEAAASAESVVVVACGLRRELSRSERQRAGLWRSGGPSRAPAAAPSDVQRQYRLTRLELGHLDPVATLVAFEAGEQGGRYREHVERVALALDRIVRNRVVKSLSEIAALEFAIRLLADRAFPEDEETLAVLRGLEARARAELELQGQ